MVVISSRYSYDSNLFSLPDGVSPATGPRSAKTWTTAVGLRLDKTYGLQRFTLDAGLEHYRYDPYDSLNFTGHSVAAAWAWTLTPQLTGYVIFNESERPNEFADTGFQLETNSRKVAERRFDVDWRPGAALHPRFSIVQSEDRSERTVFQRENSKTTSIESSLIYEFRSGNTAEGYVRQGKGDYFDTLADPSQQIDTEFDEREGGLRAKWQSTGASKLDGNIGYLDRTHKTFGIRNFNGAVGRLNYVYTITGKSELQMAAQRVLTSSQSTIGSYSADDSFTIAPSYAPTGKITIRPSWSIIRRVFKGAPTAGVLEFRETTRSASLRVDYAALRWLELSAGVSRASRVANYPNFQYVNNQAFILGRLKF